MRIVISKSFVKGVIRAINLSGTKEWPDISNSQETDYLALIGDWEDVGNSIKRECNKYGKKGCRIC